ncbi:serine hydrolase domain-containing protein [Chondrinema litorale]|uniref:serine hydrolase domain-containing protein n=1 Tax=Chondrinema litorale TaxID=2994555 RepID=UPI002543365E|nr:serine hydrolase [Chondrinema litorale]UZR98431.1 serine hydrolase [Chondrinema litorale]
MLKKLTSLILLSFSTLVSCAQKGNQDYQGNWIGTLPNKNSFNFTISLEKLKANNYHLLIANDKTLIDKNLKSASDEHIQISIDSHTHITLFNTHEGQTLTGFIKSGRYFYHISLQNAGSNRFKGYWNTFMIDNSLISDEILLAIEKNDDGTLAAYPFFGDQRFRGTWTSGFKMKDDVLLFKDDNTGFRFRAIFLKNTIDLEIYLSDAFINKVSLIKFDADWESVVKIDAIKQEENTDTPPSLNDGWETANIHDYGINKNELLRLLEDIHAKKLINVHSVLIANENKLVFESYFDGFNANIPHDLHSASKSISSAMIGIAIDDEIIKSVDQKLYEFIPETYQYTKDSLKAQISIKDLLTMSSGLDVNDLASEDYYQNPFNPKSWLQTVLEAPMVKVPGTYADYGSANPFLLGVCLNAVLEKPLEIYMDEKLFAPLGITNYINQTDDTETTPYFGGGMLLTSRDLLKFGQLFLDKGKWKDQQIISEKWVEESFQKHMQLQDVKDKNEYGYLWWHDTYIINEKAIKSIEARGAGGQFIFVLPELEAVVVITAGNFRNGKGNQSRDILKEYILPAIVEK